ncbi:hypothetical protein EHQ81_17415 [Leptospira selangorensis]|uniref:DUF5683 domain-containing protein n=1 Tax=Leptospira selangorensis TaxID=2484982 RepID=A0A5F2C1S4_9LEPT|nr:hypothetical protein [Leptospira selangorensis]TGM11449.1 hypothetical protein EHQ81_17415 [Leptospira selangorensis]TGM21098.1 hypothetical protein EHQ82_08800 [Leptospira selangorensis]
MLSKRFQKSNTIAVLLVGFLLFSLPIFGKEEGVKLEWKAIPDAGGYQVEIKDSRGKVTREKTNGTQIQIELPPGAYEHRIGVLNKYGRVSVFSAWIPFEVILSQKPEVIAAEKNKFLSKDMPETFEIKGKHFTEATKVILKDSKGNEIPVKSVDLKNPETMVVTIDKKKSPEGPVTLRLENPRNKSTERENYFLVADTEDELAALDSKSSYSGSSSGSSFFDLGAAARSAVLPGWGQYYQKKSTFRTAIFPSLIIVAGGYAAAKGNSYLNATHELDAARQSNIMYNSAFLQSGNPALFSLALYNYSQISPKYSNAVGEYNQLGVALGVLGFFYLINVLDAGFFPGPKQVKVEGTNTPVTVSPLLRNARESDRAATFASGSSYLLQQRMELGVEFTW